MPADRLPGREGATPDQVVGFLARLASEFTAVLSLPELLTHVMRSLHNELGFESASIALADDTNRQAFVIRAASGTRESHIGDVVPAGLGLHGEVGRTGMPLSIPDMNADPRVFIRDPNMRSGIYAPLTVRGRVIGVLSAHRSTPHAFSETVLDLLTVVARYLTGAVEVVRLYEQLKLLAATDVLTGLTNRRGFFDRLNAEIARAQRTGEPLSIALLDVNFPKVINNRYGHSVGDRALIAMGQTLTRSIRASDLAARVGGDELTLLLPRATFLQAENLLDRIAQTNVHAINEGDSRAAPQFAWGIATWPADGQTADVLMQAADLRLYAMKSPEVGRGVGR